MSSKEGMERFLGWKVLWVCELLCFGVILGCGGRAVRLEGCP